MQRSIRRSCLLLFLLGLWWVPPILAEIQKPNTTKQESKVEGSELSRQPAMKLPQRRVPFAHYEEALKNSEQWKTLSPEEQEEALEKIEHYRKLFRQRQAELHEKYKPILKKKPRIGSNLLHSNRDTSGQKFEDVWEKWQALTPSRQKALSQKWGIPQTVPSESRQEVLKAWKNLMPTTRQQFLLDLS